MGIRLRLQLQLAFFPREGGCVDCCIHGAIPSFSGTSCGVAADGRWRRPADNASAQVQDFVNQKRDLAGCSRDHLMHDADDGEPAACHVNPVGQLYSFLLFGHESINPFRLLFSCGPPCSKGISLAREAVAHGIPKWAY